MEEKVLNILRSVFDDASFSTNCSQDNCTKWDSMGQLNLIVELEDAFNVTFEPEDIANIHCYNDIIAFLNQKKVK